MREMPAAIHEQLPGATEELHYGVPAFLNAHHVPVLYLFGSISQSCIGDVTQSVPTENLRGLQRDGYLTRTVEPGPPVAVTYELTDLGRSLLDVLKPLVF